MKVKALTNNENIKYNKFTIRGQYGNCNNVFEMAALLLVSILPELVR